MTKQTGSVAWTRANPPLLVIEGEQRTYLHVIQPVLTFLWNVRVSGGTTTAENMAFIGR